MFNFVFLCPKRWFQFNSRIVRIHFSNIMTLNNWKMIADTRSYIFRWRSRFRRRRGCLSSLILRKTLYKFKHMSAREERWAGVKKLFVSHIASHMINRAGVRFYIERHHKQKMISNKSLTLSRKKLAKYRAMVGKSDWRQKTPITHKRPTILTNYRAMVGKTDWRQKIPITRKRPTFMRSHKLQHYLRVNPGHLTIFSSRRVGNLRGKAFPGVGNMTFAMVEWEKLETEVSCFKRFFLGGGSWQP